MQNGYQVGTSTEMYFLSLILEFINFSVMAETLDITAKTVWGIVFFLPPIFHRNELILGEIG